MDAARFHNALRIMMNLDRHHLVDAEVIRADDEGAWKAFRDYPHEASLHLNDASFDRLFALIESRQPKTSAPDMLAEMKAATGYLRNAKIDLETGATKATAIRTIEGGLKRLEAAIARTEGRQ